MYSNNKVNGFFFTRVLRLAVFVLVTTLALTGCDDAIVSPESMNEEPSAQLDLTTEERALLEEQGISADMAGNSISRAAVYTFADPSGATVGTSLVVRDNRPYTE